MNRRIGNLLRNLGLERHLLDLLFAPFLNNGGECGARNLATRETWLEKALSQIPAGSRILDAGAGELQYQRFCKHLDYTSQDFARYDGKGDKTGLHPGSWDQSKLDIVSDIVRIPRSEGSFDAVMCIEVLEHVPNPVDALRELTRLLRPGGTLIVTAPLCSLAHMSPYFFQTGFGRSFYDYWLGQFGVAIVDLQWNGNFFEFLAQELRLLPSVAAGYADSTLTEVQQQSLNVLLGALDRFSNNDHGSHELLSFGLHVLGRKRAT